MFKFLDPSGCTYYNGKAFAYNLPRRNEKWAITEHPDPAEWDGEACGSGRLHLMKTLNVAWAPGIWWPWWARGTGLVGEDREKAAYQTVELRRITRYAFWRALRPPFNWGRGADMHGANLFRVDLYRADLSSADLAWANLSRTNLSKACLSGANLFRANLTWVNLTEADLSKANLTWVNLTWANLSKANLSKADLSRANLTGANLTGACLIGTKWNQHTIWPTGFDLSQVTKKNIG